MLAVMSRTALSTDADAEALLLAFVCMRVNLSSHLSAAVVGAWELYKMQPNSCWM